MHETIYQLQFFSLGTPSLGLNRYTWKDRGEKDVYTWVEGNLLRDVVWLQQKGRLEKVGLSVSNLL